MITKENVADEFSRQMSEMNYDCGYFDVDAKEVVGDLEEEIVDLFWELIEDDIDYYGPSPRGTLTNAIWREIDESLFTFEKIKDVVDAAKEYGVYFDFDFTPNNVIEYTTERIITKAYNDVLEFILELWQNVSGALHDDE